MTLSPLADTLLFARREAQQVLYGAPLGPGDLAAGYAVQAEVAAALKAEVSGWKVGLIPDGGAFGAPILSTVTFVSGARFPLAPGIGGVKVEAELALRLKRDLPPRPAKPYTRDDILAATGEILVGIELVATRYSNTEDASFAARLADNFNNGAYVTGGACADFAALDLSKIRCRLIVDGEMKNDQIGGHGHGDPLVPVVAWANAQADALGGLRAGQFITTGTLNVPVDINGNARLEASLEGIGDVSLTVVA